MPLPRCRVRFVAALLALATGAVGAAPAHYVVFELDAQTRAQPQYHAFVDIALERDAIDPAALLRGKRDADGGVAMHVRGYAGDVLQVATVVDVAATLRAERFDRAGRMQSQAVVAGARAFVLRLPVAVRRIALDAGGGEQSFDLDAIAAGAAALPLARSTAALPRKRALGGGPPGNRVDVLIVGDGYTAADEPAFDANADEVEAGIFALSPYRDYAALVNVSRLFVASPQAGADHPPFVAGCSDASCCADAAARDDPRSGWQRDTAFDARFCLAQIHRLLGISAAKVLAAASAAPDWDRLLVLVNDPVYGGSGGVIPVVSDADGTALLVAHEWGHSFSGLADEYDAAAPGYPDCSDLGGFLPCERNVTDQSDPAQVKWRAWYTPGIPLPTPATHDGIGLFEGARYRREGMYRPVAHRCLMQTLAYDEFCPVCAESYVLRLYQGGFGIPARGIDLIEPGSESPTAGDGVVHRLGTPQRFAASVLQPVPGIAIEWLLDGVVVAGASSAQFDLRLSGNAGDKHLLQLRVTDRAAFLHPAHAHPQAVHTREWRVFVRPPLGPKTGAR